MIVDPERLNLSLIMLINVLCIICLFAVDVAGSSSTPLKTSDAVTRCFECNDYLCERCTNMHKIMRSLKQHPLVTLDDLRSEKVPLSLPDHNTCQKHRGETLTFYCETCDVPICSKCAVVAHSRPEHKQAELDSVTTEERSRQIQKLEKESVEMTSKLQEMIALNEDLKRQLETASSKARNELDKMRDSVKSEFLANLEMVYKNSTDELDSAKERK